MQKVVVSDYNVLLRNLPALAALHPPPAGVLAVDLHALVLSHLEK